LILYFYFPTYMCVGSVLEVSIISVSSTSAKD
jgi:hypothetical protein